MSLIDDTDVLESDEARIVPHPAATAFVTTKREAYARNAAENETGMSSVSFVEADPASVVEHLNPAAFFDDSYEPALARMIAHVIEVEGPLLDAVLARRIARVHGWHRTGSRIQERVSSLAARAHQATNEDVGTFFWAGDRGPEVTVAFRRPTGDSTRSVDEICMPELVTLGRQLLASGYVGEEGIVAMARELGLQRLRTASRGRFERAMEFAARP